MAYRRQISKVNFFFFSNPNCIQKTYTQKRKTQVKKKRLLPDKSIIMNALCHCQSIRAAGQGPITHDVPTCHQAFSVPYLSDISRIFSSSSSSFAAIHVEI